MKITVLYDNESLLAGTYPAHGFSALLQLKEFDVLFDAGWNGVLLIKNIEALGLNLNRLKYIFLSHQHWDHIGGVPEILEKIKRRVNFVVPASFTSGFKKELGKYGKLIEIGEAVTEFYPGLLSTGEMQSSIGIREHALFVKTGRVLVVGCSHPDVYSMAKRFSHVNILIGGFHDFNGVEKLNKVVTYKIYPCHCTVRKKEILELYPEKSEKCGVGLEVTI